MKKTETINILKALKGIVDRNTKSYTNDFDIDMQMISEDAQLSDADGKTRYFLWMSRNHGTWCFRDYKVMIRESAGYSTWMYYNDVDDDKVIACLVAVKGTAKNGEVMGGLYPLDYEKHCDYIKRHAIDISEFVALPEDKDVDSVKCAELDAAVEEMRKLSATELRSRKKVNGI